MTENTAKAVEGTEKALNDILEGALTEAQYSPYRLASIATSLKGELVRPQMLYSYVKAGRIPSSQNSTGKLQISREDAFTWLSKYLSK